MRYGFKLKVRIGPPQPFACSRVGLAMRIQIQKRAPLADYRENQHQVGCPMVLALQAEPIASTDFWFVIVTSHVFHISNDCTFILE
jgi:hypothetical protein